MTGTPRANDRGGFSHWGPPHAHPLAWAIVCMTVVCGKFLPAQVRIEPLPAPAAFERPLRLEEAELIAERNNPAVAEAAARVEALRGKWLQVGLAPNPVVGYAGQQLGSGGVAEQNGVVIGQEFVRRKKRALARQVVDQEILQAQQRWASAQYRARTDARMSYYSALVAQRRLRLAKELAAISFEAVDIATRLFQAEEGNRADVLQARIEAQTARIREVRSQARLDAAMRQLNAVLGAAAGTRHELLDEPDERLPELSWEHAVQRLLNESPEMAIVATGVERAERALQRARVEATPDIEIEAVIQDDRSINDVNGVLLATMPLPLWNRNQGGIQQALGELIAAEQSVLRKELELRRRLAGVFGRYTAARQQVDSFQQHQLPDASENLSLVGTGYQAGEFSYLQLLTAQRTFVQTSMGSLSAREEAWLAIAEIEGLLLRDSLGDR